MRAATVVQQVCKSCRTCFKFYCMFYFTCDRSFSPAYKAGSLRTPRLPGTKPTYRPLPHKCETHITSVYLADDLIRVADMPSRHRLRSVRTHRLEVPRVWLATIGDRTFRAASSRRWNSLPSDVVDCQTVDTFRRRLKHFFSTVRRSAR